MSIDISKESKPYRHYTTEECFIPPTKLIRGFTQKNFKANIHLQEFYEINIITRGSANHYIGQRTIKVSVGDTFIIPPKVLHGYDGNESVDVYHILINPKFLEKNFSELRRLSAFAELFKINPLMRERTSANLHFRLTEEEISMLTPTLDSLFLHSKRSEPVDMIIANAEALIIIAELCSIYDGRAETHNSSDTEDSAFLASMSKIYEAYAEKLTVVELARIARMSKNAYIEKFKSITGQTPAKFLRRHRVDVAKQMLKETTLTEYEIALEVGFTDTSHLVKVFLNEIGSPPSTFRDNSHKT